MKVEMREMFSPRRACTVDSAASSCVYRMWAMGGEGLAEP